MKNLSFTVFSFILLSCNGLDAKKNTPINKSTQNIDSSDILIAIPTFQIYGELAPENYIDSENPITEKYGFKVKRVGDCEVSSEEVQEVKRNNQDANRLMKTIYGNNWLRNFEKETGYKLSISL